MIRKEEEEEEKDNQSVINSENHFNSQPIESQQSLSKQGPPLDLDKTRLEQNNKVGILPSMKKDLQEKCQQISEIVSENQSETYSYTYSDVEKREKLPASVKQSLREKVRNDRDFKQRILDEIDEMQKKTDRRMIVSQSKAADVECKVCLGLFNESEMTKICDCTHAYCIECLNKYVTYNVKMYQEVVCLDEQCGLVLNQETPFYKGLPSEIKKQYCKVHQFYMTIDNPNLRLCPKEHCEGVIKIVIGSKKRICNNCRVKFCAKCYFEQHSGSCDKHEIDFLQNNFHFRQCKKCKIVVEKTEGVIISHANASMNFVIDMESTGLQDINANRVLKMLKTIKTQMNQITIGAIKEQSQS